MKQPFVVLAVAALSSLSVMTSVAANDFPTQARVEFVLSCMGERGGQSYDTLYPCICVVDRIASQMPYREYTASEMLSFLFSTPGERGGVFRDAAPGRGSASRRCKPCARKRRRRASCPGWPGSRASDGRPDSPRDTRRTGRGDSARVVSDSPLG